MNKTQKMILAIFIPIIIFFIAFTTIANYICVKVYVTPAHYVGPEENEEASPGQLIIPRVFVPEKTVRYPQPIEWRNTWYVWLLALVFCCIFEYKLFKDKKEK